MRNFSETRKSFWFDKEVIIRMQAEETGESDKEKYKSRMWRIWGTLQALFFFLMNVKIIKSYRYWDEVMFLPQNLKKKRKKYYDEQLRTQSQ